MKEITFGIIGGGVAGASAAEALRGAGFDGRIILVCGEPDAPYQRPPLSKEFLRGEIDPTAVTLRTTEFYQRNAIELLFGRRVVDVAVAKRRIQCIGGREISYDRLLIATGAVPRRLDVAGSDLPGVQYLRSLNDALYLRNSFLRRPKVVVVGTGFIGCEVAASARRIGCEVVLIGPTLPMEHVLGKEIAALYWRSHHDHGVVLKSGVTVTEFSGSSVLETARLSDGSELECDIAVVGVGVVPDVAWLPPEITVSDGVETDEFCRTSVAGIFAAGDVACSWRPRLNRRVRLEHFDNAESQGAAAGRAMHGSMQPYDPVPFFWSDQYDLSLQYFGHARVWDRVVFRGRSQARAFAAFYMKDGRIDAACTVNQSREGNVIKRLIGRAGIDPVGLADESISLKTLIPAPEVEHVR